MNTGQYTLGIDMGGTKILAGVVDQSGNILGQAKRKTQAEQSPEAVMDRIVQTAYEALAQAGVGIEAADQVGVGAPGPLDPVQGVILEAPNLGWKNVRIKDYLEAKFGKPCHIYNDVNAGTWGEYILGAGRGSQNCVGVFVGTGIGGGLVFNGVLFEGSGHLAGEIGHLHVRLKGPRCGCGKHGCLETFASRTAVARMIRRAQKRGLKTSVNDLVKDKNAQIRSGAIKKAFAQGDPVVKKAVEKAAAFLGIGLASVANLLNPDRFVLGGGLVEALGEPYIALVRRRFEARAFPSVVKSAQIVEATLGDNAGLLGAALLARQAGRSQA